MWLGFVTLHIMWLLHDIKWIKLDHNAKNTWWKVNWERGFHMSSAVYATDQFMFEMPMSHGGTKLLLKGMWEADLTDRIMYNPRIEPHTVHTCTFTSWRINYHSNTKFILTPGFCFPEFKIQFHQEIKCSSLYGPPLCCAYLPTFQQNKTKGCYHHVFKATAVQIAWQKKQSFSN